ncbi:hypothetical protein BO224_05315 [Erysipelotrichaceae bacterium NYU-BL-E8]|uniref:Uncharacterized protein n=1 Tax=Ileibacterium valens TaxID=1862668 RepID=A0A1U7NCK8_9FIRM|nr:hypothetical protein BO222_12645 [Ileibacterium valens]OLU40559.1 hypothetical protein BO224_05315 [Erysipelotrichaceae bacterium NYU-BL-E8]OLU42444.1 hypothetical protein BM735_02290 [Erysipelotrichaceae bacterium NYU-BL-F16]
MLRKSETEHKTQWQDELGQKKLEAVRGYIKAPILGVKLINTWLFQLNALGAFSLTNLVFSSIT